MSRIVKYDGAKRSVPAPVQLPLASLDIFGYNLDMENTLKQVEELQEKINSHRPFPENILEIWQEKLRIDWT